ncbi:hypothetical protein [Microcoleus sp. CAWBG58]|uniref:hypothetical protein n=1 Tax=Microcoleus sp. CAWBG58 TaxID=2841651 RepID=UPI0025CDBAC5|nr:hypothetical protein [Microcoleus sp. CAWBG58]
MVIGHWASGIGHWEEGQTGHWANRALTKQGIGLIPNSRWLNFLILIPVLFTRKNWLKVRPPAWDKLKSDYSLLQSSHLRVEVTLLRSTVNCQLSTVNCQLSTVNCQLSTVNCQLSTVNCQLSTVNCQLLNRDYQTRF